MSDRTVHVGNLEAFVNEGTLYLLFSQFGTITNVRLAGDPKYNTRYAFVEFGDSSMAQSACLLDGLLVGTRNLRVAISRPPGAGSSVTAGAALSFGSGAAFTSSGGRGRSKPNSLEDTERMTRTVHIRGIDPLVSEAYLVQIFSVCGVVTAARITGAGSPRVGWLEFATQDGAIAALGLDGQQMGSHILRVTPSKSAIQTNALAKHLGADQQQLALQLQLTSQGILQAMQTQSLALAAAPTAMSVLVTGLKPQTEEADVRTFFESTCGKVKSVTMEQLPSSEGKAGPGAADEGKGDERENGKAEKQGEEGAETQEEGGGKGEAPGSKAAVVEFEVASAVAAALALTSPTISGVTCTIEKVETPPSAAAPPGPSNPAQTLAPTAAALLGADLSAATSASHAAATGTSKQPGAQAAVGLPPPPPLAPLPSARSHPGGPGAAAIGGYDWGSAQQWNLQYNALASAGYYLPPGSGAPGDLAAAQGYYNPGLVPVAGAGQGGQFDPNFAPADPGHKRSLQGFDGGDKRVRYT